MNSVLLQGVSFMKRRLLSTGSKMLGSLAGIWILSMALTPEEAKAQLLYSQVQSNQAYATITAPDSVLVNGAIATSDDRSYEDLPIGFTFRFNGTDYTRFSVSDNGLLQFGDEFNSSSFQPLNALGNNVVALFAMDLHSGPRGVLSYGVVGTAPNRELVVEYKNWNFYGSLNDISVNINGQIRLFETTNVIQLTYGTNAPSVSRSAQVGLRGSSNSEVLSRSLTPPNLWSASMPSTSATSILTFSPTSYPDSSLTYTYAAIPPSNNDVAFVSLSNLPGPFQALCDSSQVFPVLRMRNVGLNPEIVNGNVLIFRNDTLVSTTAFGPISIAVDTAFNVSLGAFQLNGRGTYRIRVANGLMDQVASNDTATATIQVRRNCQRMNYAVSYDSTTAFTPIDSAAGFEDFWQYELTKNLPFFFRYDNIVTNRITITRDGHLVIGNSFTSYSATPIADGENVVSPFGTALDSDDPTNIKYQIIGTAPNRKAVVQWTGMTDGFIWNSPEPLPTSSSYTFQAIIDEADNAITFAYDSIFIQDNAMRVQVGISRDADKFTAHTLRSVDGNFRQMIEVKNELATIRLSEVNDATANNFNLKFTPPAYSGNDLSMAAVLLNGPNGPVNQAVCDSANISAAVVVVNNSDLPSSLASVNVYLVDINTGDNIDTVSLTVSAGLGRFEADTISIPTPFFMTIAGDYSVRAEIVTSDDDSTNNAAEFENFSFEIRECNPIPFANFAFTQSETFEPVASCARRVITSPFESQDDLSGVYSVPFPITYNGQTFNDLWVSNNGYLVMGAGTGGFLATVPQFTQFSNIISAFGIDLYVTDTSTAGVFAEVRGAAPNRYVVVEWKNAGYYSFDSRQALLNFQIHIFENGNVRYVYGNMANPTRFLPVVVGLSGETTAVQTRTMLLTDTTWAANFASNDLGAALISDANIQAETGMSFTWFNGVMANQSTGMDIALTATGPATSTVCAGGTFAPVSVSRSVVAGAGNLNNAFFKIHTLSNGQVIARDSVAMSGAVSYCDAPVAMPNLRPNFTQAGTYTIRAFISMPNSLNAANDTVTRTYIVQAQSPRPDISATATRFCAGDSVTLTATAEADVYQWSNGATTRSIRVASASNYFLRTNITGGCISVPSDTVSLSLNPSTSLSFEVSLDSTTSSISYNATGLNADSVLVSVNNAAPFNAATGVFTPTNDGTYTFRAIAYGTCGNDTLTRTVVLLNSEGSYGASKVMIWPNPVIDILHISIEGLQSEALVTLSSTTGSVVFSSKVYTEKSSFDVSNIAAGYYTLRVDRAGYAPAFVNVIKQ